MNEPQVIEEAQVPDSFTDEEKAKQLPDPVGYKLLCAIPEFDTRFDGTSIVRPQAIVDQERMATVVLFVMKMGPDAYTDKSRYPNGPWCKVGDFILVRQYSGTRMSIYGKEFRLINEDQVEAVVQDPRGLSRA
jgi:co-chaperonin GroES (HSP10)